MGSRTENYSKNLAKIVKFLAIFGTRPHNSELRFLKTPEVNFFVLFWISSRVLNIFVVGISRKSTLGKVFKKFLIEKNTIFSFSCVSDMQVVTGKSRFLHNFWYIYQKIKFYMSIPMFLRVLNPLVALNLP